MSASHGERRSRRCGKEWKKLARRGKGMRGISKSKRGFRYGVWQGPKSGHKSIKELVAGDRYVDAVLHFLKPIKVGEVEGRARGTCSGGWAGLSSIILRPFIFPANRADRFSFFHLFCSPFFCLFVGAWLNASR